MKSLYQTQTSVRMFGNQSALRKIALTRCNRKYEDDFMLNKPSKQFWDNFYKF